MKLNLRRRKMPEDIEDVRSAAITDVSGDGNVDATINSIILALEKAGIIADN